ncbi:hypothetical protein [Bacillus thuringiensis]|uniref:hypothetical protein n=1 Tax=Bacillus thuringiensis TaxID=1428 RepID=UPI000D65106A|nr:hypothetical protein [Bacillus thuringiensis]
MKELFLKPGNMAIVINDSEYGLKKESMWSLSKNNLILKRVRDTIQHYRLCSSTYKNGRGTYYTKT